MFLLSICTKSSYILFNSLYRHSLLLYLYFVNSLLEPLFLLNTQSYLKNGTHFVEINNE